MSCLSCHVLVALLFLVTVLAAVVFVDVVMVLVTLVVFFRVMATLLDSFGLATGVVRLIKHGYGKSIPGQGLTALVFDLAVDFGLEAVFLGGITICL